MSAATEWETARALADQLDQWGDTAPEAGQRPQLVDTAAASLALDGWDMPGELTPQLRDLTVAMLALDEWDDDDDMRQVWRPAQPIRPIEREPDEVFAEAQQQLAQTIAHIGCVDWRHINPGRVIDRLATAMRQVATARAAAEAEINELHSRLVDMSDEIDGLRSGAIS